MSEEINHCSELDCPANQDGSCKITTCILLDPKKAIEEYAAMKHEESEKACYEALIKGGRGEG